MPDLFCLSRTGLGKHGDAGLGQEIGISRGEDLPHRRDAGSNGAHRFDALCCRDTGQAACGAPDTIIS